MITAQDLDRVLELCPPADWLPEASVTVSEWADASRMLPDTSAEPGQWHTARPPAPSSRVLQWVALRGVDSRVRVTTASIAASASWRGRPGRGSSSKPSSRWSTKR